MLLADSLDSLSSKRNILMALGPATSTSNSTCLLKITFLLHLLENIQPIPLPSPPPQRFDVCPQDKDRHRLSRPRRDRHQVWTINLTCHPHLQITFQLLCILPLFLHPCQRVFWVFRLKHLHLGCCFVLFCFTSCGYRSCSKQ